MVVLLNKKTNQVIGCLITSFLLFAFPMFSSTILTPAQVPKAPPTRTDNFREIVTSFLRSAEDDFSILYVRQELNGKDEVLIDPHTLS